jgi:hypothetical protein
VWYFWLWITAWVNIGNKSKHSIKIIVSKYFALTAVITSYHLLSFSIIKRFSLYCSSANGICPIVPRKDYLRIKKFSNSVRANKLILIVGVAVVMGLFSMAQVSQRETAPNPQPPDLLPSSTTRQIIKHNYYTLSYAERYEQAEWVAYWLKPNQGNANFKRPYFIADPKVSTHSADYKNYKNSGYDKGHLCAAADMKFSKGAFAKPFTLPTSARKSMILTTASGIGSRRSHGIGPVNTMGCTWSPEAYCRAISKRLAKKKLPYPTISTKSYCGANRATIR